MRKIIFMSNFIWFFASIAIANTGYFAGSGQTITLTKTEEIQLVSEEVTITPKCGWQWDSDSVDYRCKFFLKNLSKKSVKAQIGFPLDSQHRQQAKESDATDLVLDYHFLARDESNTYHVRYVPSDSQHKFSRLFLWDMNFKPGETKVLHVAYELPMSRAISITCKQEVVSSGDFLRHEKRWHAYLETCILEQFEYVTETGKSWSGPIEKATFQVEVGPFVSCLSQRTMWPLGFDFPELQLDSAIESGQPFTVFSKGGPIYERVLPQGGKFDPKYGTTTWEYENYKPGESIYFVYYTIPLPRNAAACDYWVRFILGDKPQKTDLVELREIVAAFYGIAPQSESAKKFVKRQIWYQPQKDLQETQLIAEQQAVLKRLDAIKETVK